MTIPEYEIFSLQTSSGMSDADAARMRVLTVAERRGDGATAEPSSPKARIRARLSAAKRALQTAETARQVASDLVQHLKQQLADK